MNGEAITHESTARGARHTRHGGTLLHASAVAMGPSQPSAARGPRRPELCLYVLPQKVGSPSRSAGFGYWTLSQVLQRSRNAYRSAARHMTQRQCARTVVLSHLRRVR